MRRRALLCTIGATALAGCGGRLDGSTDDTATSSTTATETPDESTTRAGADPALELVDHELVRTNAGSAGELASVVGTVRNPTEETVAEAVATATFEDAAGAVLGRATADVADLGPGRTWSFELVYPGTGDAAEVADYSLAVETGN